MNKRSKPKLYKPNYLFNLDDNSFMALNLATDTLDGNEILTMNFGNYENSYQDYTVYTDRETLKRMADFINKYLENN